MLLIKGDQAVVRTLNRRLVLNHLRAHGPASRTELAVATGLSSAAVTQVTGELLQEGFLVALEGGAGGVGRRPVPLDIHYAGHFAVGVKLMEDHLQAVLTDLSTLPLTEVTRPVPPGHDPEEVAQEIAQAVQALVQAGSVAPDRVIGVGIGLGGIIDAERGVAQCCPRLGWQDVPFAALVRAAAGVPVWLDNDVNAFAAAQALFGHARHAQEALVVIVGRGIGAGLLLGGKLYRGHGGGAGEIGHSISEPGGALCTCGRRGCLEAYASEEGLLARLAECRPDLAGAGAADLPALAVRHPEVLDLLQDGGARLGRALGQLVNALDPGLLVLGGEGLRLGEAYYAAVRRELGAGVYPPLAANLRLVTETWGDDVWARGAASLAVRQVFLSTTLLPT